MKTNLRKEQEKLAVLLEISDTPKKNSDIIKGAESRLIMDEAYTRLLSDKKTTAGKKELQFILYFLKRDNAVNVENRGIYTSNEATAVELIKTAHIIDDALKMDEKSPCILTSEAVEEMGLICSAHPILVEQAEVSSGFEVIGGDEPTSSEEAKTETEEKTGNDLTTSDTQVKKTEKQSKKGKSNKKGKENPKT